VDSTENVPARIQAEARAKALAVLNSEPGCISYVRPEDLETAALFIPIVSIIKPTPEDFHQPIPGIGILPKVPLQNAIREKSGTNIIRTDDDKRSEYVWTAHSFGERRMPDGTMEKTDGIYEYDAEKRAEEDFLKQPDKYNSETLKRKHVLELCRFAQSKAVTGAQWIVIKKLAKVASSFKTPQELQRGMKLIRYDRNINGIMADPSMREAIINHALGAAETVFGPKQIPHTVDVETQEVIERASAEEGQVPMFPEEDPPKAEPTAEEKLKEILKDYLAKIPADLKAPSGKTIRSRIQDLIDKKDATVEDLNPTVDWCSQFIQRQQEGSTS
jgi:hypothetical protein